MTGGQRLHPRESLLPPALRLPGRVARAAWATAAAVCGAAGEVRGSFRRRVGDAVDRTTASGRLNLRG